MMKNFKKIVLSVLGVVVIATGFVACSSDDSHTENVDESQKTTMSVNSMSRGVPVKLVNPFDSKYKVCIEYLN